MEFMLFSPVLESGVDITIPMKNMYGVMSAQSKSQRAFLQMIARCRHVTEPVISIKKDEHVPVHDNYNF